MKKKWLIPAFAAFMLYAGADIDSVEAASTTELTTAADKYIGVPYAWGGTTSRGFDCSGYIQKVFSDLGIKISRTTSSQYGEGTAVSKSNLQVGDLVFFTTYKAGPSHVGIYLGNGDFIHASTSRGVTVSNMSERYWAPKYIGARRIADFTEPAKVTTVAKAEVKPAAIDFSVYASRGEVAIQLAKALGLDTSDTNSGFSDVKPTDKYAGAVTALKKIGVFAPNEKFNPNSPITRSQIAKVLVVGFELQLNEDHIVTFKDTEKDWAKEYIDIIASHGISIGINGNFDGNGNVKLTQLADFIKRSIQ